MTHVIHVILSHVILTTAQQVQQAVRDAIAACRAAGVPAGCISGDEGACRRMLEDDGAGFVALGTYLMLLAARVRALTAKLG